MSGGFFDYSQYKLNDIADSIHYIIRINNTEEKMDSQQGFHFHEHTIDKFRETERLLRKCQTMVTRIDWLLEGDDDEDTFHQRWHEELDR